MMMKNFNNFLTYIAHSIYWLLSKKISVAIIFLFIFWLMCFHWTGIHEVGIRRNIFTGELSLDDKPGPEISWPWVQVVKIDTRPRRICIECGCKNMNCVLVSFEPVGWRDFVDREGFRYYWWTNRFSFNSGANREYRGDDYLIKGYAFDEKNYSFITVEKNVK